MTIPITTIELCKKLSRQVSLGYGIIPFVGSGLSASSGILTGQEFTDYLAYSIYATLNNFWDIRRQGWPDAVDYREMEKVRRWYYGEYEKSCARVGFDLGPVGNGQKVTGFGGSSNESNSSNANILLRPLIPEMLRPDVLKESEFQLLKTLLNGGKHPGRFAGLNGISPGTTEYAIDYAMRCSFDWRASLTTLAKLNVEAGKDNNREMVTVDDESNSAVFDSFNVHITRGRQPNLGHKMLAHLVRAFRSRVLFTTNFDPLLESAFERINRHLNVISVQKSGQLPSLQIVRSADCIIKLHGSLLETRSDLSLDDIPSREDLKVFSDIVTGASPDSATGNFSPSHLLVVGYSASDMRCVEMIKRCISQNDVKVFWICFRESDRKRVEQAFSERVFEQKIYTCLTSRPDLLLYEMYQRLHLTIPSGGFSYQYSARIPATLPPFGNDYQKRVSVKRRQFEGGMESLESLCEGDTEFASSSNLQDTQCQQQQRQAGRRLVKSVVADALTEKIILELFRTPEDNEKKQRKAQQLSEDYSCRFQVDRLKIADSGTEIKTKMAGTQNGIVVVKHDSESLEAIDKLIEKCQSEKWKKTIFLEAQDYSSPSCLIRDLLLNLSLEKGTFQTELVNLTPEFQDAKQADEDEETWRANKETWKNHVESLLQQLHIKADNWVVVLYARSGYGTNSSWFGKLGNWTNQGGEETYKKFLLFWRLLDLLNEIGFKIVYFPLHQSSIDSEKYKAEKLSAILEDERFEAKWSQNEKYEAPFPFETWQRDPNDLSSHFAADPFITVDPEKEFASEQHRKSSSFENMFEEVISKFVNPYKTDPFNKLARDKMSFLYALTLFRQSRHISCFFSDATIGAQLYFNMVGADNDVKRAKLSEKWLSELKTIGIIHDKPGGFYWIHRDMRNGIRRFLESLNFNYFRSAIQDDDKQNNDELFRHYVRIVSKRASLHRTIAEWYQKAFLTNGHFTPLIESLYHFAMAALCSEFALPGFYIESSSSPKLTEQGEPKYRYLMMHSALVEMLKMIQIGNPLIVFWLANPNGLHMFSDEQFGELTRVLEKVAKKIGRSKNELKNLQCVLTRLIDSVKSINADIQDERRVDVGHSIPVSKYAVLVEPDSAKTGSHNILPSKEFFRTPNTRLEQPDWWNEWTSRLTELGCEDFLEPITTHQNANLNGTVSPSDSQSSVSKIREEASKYLASAKYKPYYLFVVIETLGQLAYQCTKRAKLENDARKKNMAEPEKKRSIQVSKTYFQTVSILAYIGISFCRNLDPLFLERELQLKSKLSTLYGLALGHLNRFYEAHRRLTESQRFLSKTTSGKLQRIEHGIIRLRRAEIFLVQAEQLFTMIDNFSMPKFDAKIEIDSFDLIRQAVQTLKPRSVMNPLGVERDEGPKAKLILLRKKFLVQACIGYLDDAASLLEHSERQLSGTSQHSLWWGCLYTLKLQTFAFETKLTDSEHKLFNFKSLIRRRSIDYSYEIERLFDRGIMATLHSDVRQLRLIDFFVNAWKREKKRCDENYVRISQVLSRIAPRFNTPPDRNSEKAEHGELAHQFFGYVKDLVDSSLAK